MSRASTSLSVGILGGMGPEATVDLMRRVIELTPAHDDQDHIRLLVDNNPGVPSRIAAIIEKTGPSPAPVLVRMARGLEEQGAAFLAMPCNTAHHYHGEIAASVSIPFLSIPELVCEHLRSMTPAITRVGLLASSALQTIHLYEPYLHEAGMELVYPTAPVQDSLMGLIRAVKSGTASDEELASFQVAADEVVALGAQALVIACTELSVVAEHLRGAVPTCDAADLLARAVVDCAQGRREPPSVC